MPRHDLHNEPAKEAPSGPPVSLEKTEGPGGEVTQKLAVFWGKWLYLSESQFPLWNGDGGPLWGSGGGPWRRTGTGRCRGRGHPNGAVAAPAVWGQGGSASRNVLDLAEVWRPGLAWQGHAGWALPSQGSWIPLTAPLRGCGHTALRLRPGDRGPRAASPAQHRAPPTGVIMVFSTSAFGAYFKLTEGAPSNSSLVDFLAPVSTEPAGASVGLAWLAVGSMCLFIAGERGPRGGQGRLWGYQCGRPVTARLPWPPASPGLPPSPLHICPHLCVYSWDHVPCTELSSSLPLSLNPGRRLAHFNCHLLRTYWEPGAKPSPVTHGFI